MNILIPLVLTILVTASLIGTVYYTYLNKYKNRINSNELNCDCIADFNTDFYPWQVSIGRLNLNQNLNSSNSLERSLLESHLCGAVILNSKWILSSAHCVRFHYDEKIGVGYGSGDLLAIYHKGRIPIKNIIYNSTNKIDDVALIELENEIIFKNEPLVKPACLNSNPISFTDRNNYLISTGWNLFEKQFANKDYFEVQRYHSQIVLKDVSDENTLCANNKTKICVRSTESDKCKCFTDTGAPIHFMNLPNLTTVVGLHQATLINQNGKLDGCPVLYFTRLSEKIDFIQDVVGKNKFCLI